jgi:hypothetical protein
VARSLDPDGRRRAKALSVLHGELIAFEWIQQNTGQALVLADGTLSACYRITLHGLREYRHIQGIEMPVEAPEKPQSGFARKKKEKTEAHAFAASEESLVPAATTKRTGGTKLYACV